MRRRRRAPWRSDLAGVMGGHEGDGSDGLRDVGVQVLHMIWNAPLPSPLYARHLAIGFVGWMVVFGLVQDGLRQIQSVQAARRAAGGATRGGAAGRVIPGAPGGTVPDTTDLVGP